MQITFDTSNLSAHDRQVLAFLAGGEPPKTVGQVALEMTTPKVTEPVVKAAPVKAEPVVVADKEPGDDPADEVPTSEEAGAGGDDAITMDEVVAKATQLMASGQSAKVKAALAGVGAKRVSEVDSDKLADFVAALDAA